MKTEVVLLLTLWGIFGMFRILIPIRTKGTLKVKTNDGVYLQLVLPYMLSVVVSVFEFDLGNIKLNFVLVAIGLIFFIAGSALQIIALFALRNNFSNAVELQKDHTLIKSGIYSIIRHPLYLGIILQVISTPFLLNVKLAWILIIWSIIGVFIRIKEEDRFLVANLPDYKAYKEKTSALLPGIF